MSQIKRESGTGTGLDCDWDWNKKLTRSAYTNGTHPCTIFAAAAVEVKEYAEKRKAMEYNGIDFHVN